MLDETISTGKLCPRSSITDNCGPFGEKRLIPMTCATWCPLCVKVEARKANGAPNVRQYSQAAGFEIKCGCESVFIPEGK